MERFTLDCAAGKVLDDKAREVFRRIYVYPAADNPQKTVFVVTTDGAAMTFIRQFGFLKKASAIVMTAVPKAFKRVVYHLSGQTWFADDGKSAEVPSDSGIKTAVHSILPAEINRDTHGRIVTLDAEKLYNLALSFQIRDKHNPSKDACYQVAILLPDYSDRHPMVVLPVREPSGPGREDSAMGLLMGITSDRPFYVRASRMLDIIRKTVSKEVK